MCQLPGKVRVNSIGSSRGPDAASQLVGDCHLDVEGQELRPSARGVGNAVDPCTRRILHTSDIVNAVLVLHHPFSLLACGCLLAQLNHFPAQGTEAWVMGTSSKELGIVCKSCMRLARSQHPNFVLMMRQTMLVAVMFVQARVLPQTVRQCNSVCQLPWTRSRLGTLSAPCPAPPCRGS